MHPLHMNLILLLSFSRYILSVLSAPSAPEQQVIPPLSTEGASSIHDALKYSSVISEVLDDFEPTHSLSITYPKSHESVQLGNDIPVASVSSRPAFEFHAMSVDNGTPGSSNKTFTLILTDPDAKSRDNPKWSEMCHWILTNLTAPVTSGINISKNGELVEYLPPTPPPKTGKHRYVFVLLEGQEGPALSTPKDRKHWGFGKIRHGVRDWAKENELKVVGANFFYAQDKKQ
jgi:phosphatidylethanolamine-binding protein